MIGRLLDHGYVRLIESWGSDERIIEAARMSTDKGFQGWGGWKCDGLQEPEYVVGDEKLLKYLYEHKHMTPFEMGGLTLEVQAPIFVFREWHRHRTQSYNELSARYTELPNLYYIPSIERLQHSLQSTKNRQSSSEGLSRVEAETLQGVLRESQVKARATYESLLAQGVAREVARLVVPVSQYSRMRASANLRNWLGFLALRMDQSAQWEIRQYAIEVGKLVREKFPRTWQLFMEER